MTRDLFFASKESPLVQLCVAYKTFVITEISRIYIILCGGVYTYKCCVQQCIDIILVCDHLMCLEVAQVAERKIGGISRAFEATFFFFFCEVMIVYCMLVYVHMWPFSTFFRRK